MGIFNYSFMRKKIAILGSTGSIGQTLLKILEKDKKNFEIVLLTANKNYKKLFQQAEKFKVKNLIINENKIYNRLRNKKNFKIYNSFKDINLIFKKKIDYVMCSIVGLDGLYPTIKLIKHTKKIAIANKESIICGWNLIQKELKKNKTEFIPVDSEHYSIFALLENYKNKDIENVYITASGGPFLNYPKSKFRLIKPKNALKHPNWKMGKKITIDSATLMNKVFEVIEAKNIFGIPYHKISILTHPKSYLHAIVKFKNGIAKILVHEPDMKIPILNSLNQNLNNKIFFKNLNFEILNDLKLQKVNLTKFPLVRLLDKMPLENSLYETVLITINDFFVNKFLQNKISFNKMMKLIFKLSNSKDFVKYKKILPKKIEDIYKLRDYVSLKLTRISI